MLPGLTLPASLLEMLAVLRAHYFFARARWELDQSAWPSRNWSRCLRRPAPTCGWPWTIRC